MQFIVDLWKPILLGGFGTFVMSALVWTVMPHHRKEWRKLLSEDAVSEAIRAGAPAPGLYHMPNMADMSEMGTPEGKAKMERGPIAYITIVRNGIPSMGPAMAKSALWCVLVALFVAYVCWHALPLGAGATEVLRVAGAMTFSVYALGNVGDSIWFGRPWSSWGLQLIDAVIYTLVVGGSFAWLWP